MAQLPEPTPEVARARWVRPLLILSGAILGLIVAWLFSLVSGIPLPLWEAIAALILGALLGFSASLPSASSRSHRGL
ncbi:hypothetical protein [Thermoflexus sp.]|uniref:hypothetical protein n=1 Tax=Thermoflexus sp. TaxID=1969742 RepID=UPI0035E461DB